MTETPTTPTAPPAAPRIGVAGLLDAVLPIAAFMLGTALLAPEPAAGIAVLCAAAIAAYRTWRGDSARAALAGLALVAVHAAFVLASGDGRAYFLPELLGNALLAAVFTGSVLIGRPVSRPLARIVLGEPRDAPTRRLHARITLLWAGFWLVHLAVWTPLYLADQVALLGLTTVVLGKPLLVVLTLATWRILHRSPAARPVSTGGTA